ncbi:MAG: NACHT domain-containing protein [Caldilinea sp. CFX5]|nr:NACHT domain-containing protein [Caldilinea sp. CFX5]
MSHRLELFLFGGLQIRYNAQWVTDLVSRKVETLLAYIACNQRPYPREVLADLFWGNRQQNRAGGNLRVALNSLREKTGPFITADRYTIAISQDDDLWVDVLTFEQLLRPFAQWQDRRGELPPPLVTAMEQALALYRGEFLEGVFLRDAPLFEEWVRVERERLHILATKAIQALSLHYLATRQHALGINAVQRWLHFDLLNEEAHRTLMLLLVQEGHQSAALHHYEQFVKLFQDELGDTPSAETEELYYQILDRAIAPLAAGDSNRSGTEEAPADTRPLRPIPNNLDAALSPLVGRTRELAHILERLSAPECRLLTLLGIGGAGKTRLAQEAALRLTQQSATLGLFPDGVFWVRLEHVETEAHLLSALAQAIHYLFQGPATPAKQLLDFLRQRRLLLVLDNVEQLVGQSELILQILHAAPGIKLLVTSRERLDFQGEWLLEINGLPYPTSADQEGWEAFPAVQLFIQCASAVSPDFTPQAQRQALVQICQMMEGLPLGIQLAAVSVRAFSGQQIVTALKQNLDFLSSSMRNLPLRHRSLRAVFEHSWLLLSAAEKHAFQRLAIFEGSFSAQAATAVAEIPISVLIALIDKSLVYVIPVEGGAEGNDGERRYRMHTTLHQYAAEKLAAAAEALDGLLRRHALYYGEWVAMQTAALYAEQAAHTSDLVAGEIENIRKSWQTAVALRMLPVLQRYLPGLVQYFRLRGFVQEGQALLTTAIEQLAGQRPDAEGVTAAQQPLVSQLLAYKAGLLVDFGRYEEAIGCAQNAITLAEASQDRLGEALGYLQWGAALHRQANYGMSDEKLAKALTLAQAANASKVEADVYLYMGRNRFYLGDYTGGQTRHDQAMRSYRAVGDLVDELAAQNSLAMLYLFAGDYAKAQAAYERCLAAYRHLNNQPAIGLTLNNLGALATVLGQYAAAQRYYEESLALRRRVGGRQSEALILANLALIAHQTGANKQACDYAQSAVQLSIELGERDNEAYAHLCLGHAQAALDHWVEAIAAYQRTLSLRRQAGQQTQALESLAGLARIAFAQGNLTEAKAYIDEIVPYLSYDTYAGIVELIRVYLTCYQVLTAVQDERATPVLTMGHTILQERANKIAEPSLRDAYLHIAAHAELRRLYAEGQAQ